MLAAESNGDRDRHDGGKHGRALHDRLALDRAA
jgi:hypothetical protein